MSIGKFFILAILLPMATIYLTLTLKGENKSIAELDKEQERILELGNQELKNQELEKLELERLNSDNFKIVFEKPEPSLNNQIVVAPISNTVKPIKKIKNITTNTTIKTNSTTPNSSVSKSTIFSLEKSSQSNQLITSIEAMIKFKKNKGKEQLKAKNYSDIFNDESNVQKTPNKPVKVTNNTNTKTIKKSGKVTKNHSKQLVKITKPKIVKKPIIKKQLRAEKTKIKKTKVVKIKTPTTQQKLSNRKKITTVNIDNINNNENPQKRSFFNKQDNPKKRKLNRSTQEILSKLQENNFGDVFDDDGEPDIEVSDVIEPTAIQENNNSTENTKKEQFTSNPCSGGSARYIARCRK